MIPVLLQLVAKADVNKDGVIDYPEFIPIAVELMRAVSGMQKQESGETEDGPPRPRWWLM